MKCLTAVFSAMSCAVLLFLGIFCFLLLVFDMINVGVHITESAEKNSWIADFETFVE